MKSKYMDLLRKVQFPLLIAFATSPIVLFLYAYLAPQALAYAWVIPAAYVILLLPCLVIPGKWRFLPGIVGFFLILLLGFSIRRTLQSFWFLPLSLLFACFLLSGLQFAGLSRGRELSAFWYGAGLVIHIIAQIKVLTNRIEQKTALEPVAPWLAVCFFVFLLLAMLSSNRGNLARASQGRGNIPAALRRKQTLLIVGLFSLTLLLALTPAIVDGIKAVWNWLGSLVAGFFAWLDNLLSSDSNNFSPVISGDSQLVPLEAGKPQRVGGLDIALILGKLFTFLAIGLLAFLLLRQLAKLLRILWSRLNSYVAHASEDYVDEVTNTRDSGTIGRFRAMRERRRIIAVDERTLSPGDRIRHRYLRLLLKHPEWSAGNTARENIPDQAARLYERARYSEHAVTEDDAGQFTDCIRQI